ncbi:kinase [Xylanibacillus composti]|uniref:Kinase n=1 Tax=Xylanibacillus composti TaxID=1572762 RepID=A0A8J4M2N5_9BACL|nr:kinase-associated lipoprotein B [Xylanibacillus composti]MDT9724294.1 kinase [Xylanibacillus composti]GIQ69290.1 kinase [Xylanibacillus composti]
MEREQGHKSSQAANETLQPGDPVVAEYKTGVYIGELVELIPGKAKVRVLAVVKHPEQGNLHVGHRTDVSMFHQRRALAFREVANMPLASVRRYTSEIPDYYPSLQGAIRREIEELEERAKWARQSVESLRELQGEYDRQYAR